MGQKSSDQHSQTFHLLLLYLSLNFILFLIQLGAFNIKSQQVLFQEFTEQKLKSSTLKKESLFHKHQQFLKNERSGTGAANESLDDTHSNEPFISLNSDPLEQISEKFYKSQETVQKNRKEILINFCVKKIDELKLKSKNFSENSQISQIFQNYDKYTPYFSEMVLESDRILRNYRNDPEKKNFFKKMVLKYFRSYLGPSAGTLSNYENEDTNLFQHTQY